MTVHPYQADPKWKHSCTTCRDFVKLPLDVNGIDSGIYTQIPKTPHNILFHMADLEYGINIDIGTLKKYRGEIFRILHRKF